MKNCLVIWFIDLHLSSAFVLLNLCLLESKPKQCARWIKANFFAIINLTSVYSCWFSRSPATIIIRNHRIQSILKVFIKSSFGNMRTWLNLVLSASKTSLSDMCSRWELAISVIWDLRCRLYVYALEMW